MTQNQMNPSKNVQNMFKYAEKIANHERESCKRNSRPNTKNNQQIKNSMDMKKK